MHSSVCKSQTSASQPLLVPSEHQILQADEDKPDGTSGSPEKLAYSPPSATLVEKIADDFEPAPSSPYQGTFNFGGEEELSSADLLRRKNNMRFLEIFDHEWEWVKKSRVMVRFKDSLENPPEHKPPQKLKEPPEEERPPVPLSQPTIVDSKDQEEEGQVVPGPRSKQKAFQLAKPSEGKRSPPINKVDGSLTNLQNIRIYVDKAALKLTTYYQPGEAEGAVVRSEKVLLEVTIKSFCVYVCQTEGLVTEAQKYL